MLRFREISVTSDEATGLLEAYFAERARGFPASQGFYRPAFPTAPVFTPPAGVFLAGDETGWIGPDGGREGADGRAPGRSGKPPAQASLACGGIRRIDPGGDGQLRYEVKHLWVRPEARGRGYGRRLLEELERRARDFGAEELVLDTNASLEVAGGLYRSSGFAPVAPYNENPNATDWYGKRLV